MSFERDFFEMMPETVSYRAYSSLSTDGYASKVYSPAATDTAKSVRARVEPHKTIVKDVNGREVVSSIRVFLAPWSTAGTSDSINVGPSDLITLPSGFLLAGSSAPPIIAAYRTQDEGGMHHNEVLI